MIEKEGKSTKKAHRKHNNELNKSQRISILLPSVQSASVPPITLNNAEAICSPL